MESILVTLDRPISRFVDHRSRERHTSPQQTVLELVTLGFDTLLYERYDRYRRGDISFGRLAQDLGITAWELSHLLEERGWPVHNLPAAGVSARHVSLHEAPAAYDLRDPSHNSDSSAE